MAVIPRYDNPTVQTVGLAIPQAQALGPDAFGAGLGAGLSKGGAVLGVIAAKEQEKADETVIADRKAKLLTEYNKISVGALATKGDAATGYTDAEGKIIEPVDQIALQDFDKKVSEIGMGLSERQSAKFRDAVNSHRAHLELSTMTHVIGQREAVRQEKLGSLVEIQYQTAAMAQTDAEKAQAVSDLQDTLSSLYTNHSDEKYTTVRDKMWSDLHAGWITSTLEKNPAKGKTMYEEAVKNGDLDAIDKARLEGKVQTVYTATEGALLGKTTWDTMGPAAEMAQDPQKFKGNVLNVPVDMAGMERSIKDKYPDDPVLQKVAVAELHGFYQAFKSNVAEQREYNTDIVWGRLSKEGLKSVSAIMASPEYNALPGKDQMHFESAVRAEARAIRAEQKGNAYEHKQAMTEYRNEFMGSVTPEILAGMKEEDIRGQVDRLGITNVNHLLSVRKTWLKDDSQLAKAQSDDALVKVVMVESGLDWANKGAKMSKDQKMLIGSLKDQVEQVMQYEGQAKHAPVSPERQREIVRGLLTKTVAGGWFKKDEYEFQRPAYNRSFPGYSSEQVAHVTSVLATKGIKKPSYGQVANGLKALTGGQ